MDTDQPVLEPEQRVAEAERAPVLPAGETGTLEAPTGLLKLGRDAELARGGGGPRRAETP